MRSLGFFLRETFEGIRRHSIGSLVTFLQVFSSLFMLGICLMFIININSVLASFLTNLEMIAFLKDTTTVEQANDLMDVVKRLPGVRKVHYISKEEALEFMRQRMSIDIKEFLDRNPLPASLKITVANPKIAGDLAGPIELLEGVEDVRYGKEQLQSLMPIIYLFILIFFFMTLIFAAITLVTITNTVRLAILARRQEIKIMQLVGATSWFIRVPFMLEGFIYGILGAAMALILHAITYNLVLEGFAARNPYNPWMISFELMMNNLSLIIFILGGVIGVIASLIAVGKHLEEDIYRPTFQNKGVPA